MSWFEQPQKMISDPGPSHVNMELYVEPCDILKALAKLVNSFYESKYSSNHSLFNWMLCQIDQTLDSKHCVLSWWSEVCNRLVIYQRRFWTQWSYKITILPRWSCFLHAAITEPTIVDFHLSRPTFIFVWQGKSIAMKIAK
jgi:hypothetical protein